MTSDSESRVTRSRRSLLRSTVLFVAVLAGVTVLRAQDASPTAPPRQAPAAAAGISAEEAETPVGSNDTKSTPEPAGNDEEAVTSSNPPAAGAQDGKPAGKVGPTQDHFEPTEKVRADFDVSFPVDI
jgi:hypothetical protein